MTAVKFLALITIVVWLGIGELVHDHWKNFQFEREGNERRSKRHGHSAVGFITRGELQNRTGSKFCKYFSATFLRLNVDSLKRVVFCRN